MILLNKKQYFVKGHLALIIANIIFGVNASFSKVLLNTQLSPFLLMLLRIVGATLLFWFVSLFTPREKIEKKDFLILFLAACFGIVFNQGLFLVGLQRTSPIDAILLQTLTPIITMLVALMHLKEPITVKKIGGVFMGFGGALFLILHNNQMGGSSSNFIGNIFILTGALSYAIYLTFFLKVIRKYSPISVMKWLFFFASLITIPLWHLDFSPVPLTTFGLYQYFLLLFIIIGATFLTYLLIPIGQKNLRPTLVSMYIYVQPVVVSLVSIFLGIGQISWHTFAAAFFIFGGVYLVTRSKSRKDVLDAQEIN